MLLNLLIYLYFCSYISDKLGPQIFSITAQIIKFSIKDFFSKRDQIRRKLRIWSNLLKKPLMENFLFCAVYSLYVGHAPLMFWNQSNRNKGVQLPVIVPKIKYREKILFFLPVSSVAMVWSFRVTKWENHGTYYSFSKTIFTK